MRRPWPRACSVSDYDCAVATSGPEGLERLGQEAFDLVITDLVMNDVDGLQILARTKETLPDAEVVLVTGHGTIPSAVTAMQQGAFNYLLKPLDLGQLRAVAEKAVASVRLRHANAELNRRLDERFGFEGVVGSSPQMNDVIERLEAHRAHRRQRADPGGHRHRQGAGRPGHPSKQPAQEQALRGAELRGAEREHPGERAVRPRAAGRLPTPRPIASANSNMPTAARCFWTKSATCRWPRRSSCCACWRAARSPAWARTKPMQVNVRILSATNRNLEELDRRRHVSQRPVPPAQGRHDHAAAAWPSGARIFRC